MQPGSVLVVDDNDMSREMLARRLQRSGHRAVVAAGGQQALDLIAEQPFDLVLLDILMPDVDGLEVLKRIRATFSTTELPVIMATAKDESSDVVEALKLGANDYVTKPLDYPVVLARVQTQLALKQSVDKVIDLEKAMQRQVEELARSNRWLEHANDELAAANQRMKHDLHMAAQVQRTLLPSVLPEFPRVRFAWELRPCTELAGDLLGVVRISENKIALYVVDVAGHGAAAALLSVMVSRVLSRLVVAYTPGTEPRPYLSPSDVIGALVDDFASNAPTELYFTIVYGILDIETHEFRFTSAGHPGPILLKANGKPKSIDTPGQAIGWEVGPYKEQVLKLEAGDRLILYTDGLTGMASAQKELFGKDRLLEGIAGARPLSLKRSLQTLLESALAWCHGTSVRDDVSILACEVGDAVLETLLPTPTPLPEMSGLHSRPSDPVLALESMPPLANQFEETILGMVANPRTGPQVPTPAPVDDGPTQPIKPLGLTPVTRRETEPLSIPGAGKTGIGEGPTRAGSGAIPPFSRFPYLQPPREPNEIGWLGQYRVLSILGTGGMATVFVAEDSDLQRRVALKVMKPELADNEIFRQRFLREARAVAAINHDHIVTIFQVGQDQNTPYFAMQLLQGESLHRRLDRQKLLPPYEAVMIAREIADGLSSAHERDLIHRDIKPDNIWLETRSGALPRVKILDFGLAQARGGDQLTKTGLVMGTPNYMSPEQARGLSVDARSDLFSLGCVMYRMCSGTPPFGEGDTMAILTALAIDNPKPIRDLNPDVPKSLGNLLGQLLAKDREKRPASAANVIEELRAIEMELAGSMRYFPDPRD